MRVASANQESVKLCSEDKRRHLMGIPKPLAKEQAPAELQNIYDKIQKDVGMMYNAFSVLARFPAALRTLIPFYDAIMHKGKIEPKYKELAYLKTSSVNDCHY